MRHGTGHSSKFVLTFSKTWSGASPGGELLSAGELPITWKHRSRSSKISWPAPLRDTENLQLTTASLSGEDRKGRLLALPSHGGSLCFTADRRIHTIARRRPTYSHECRAQADIQTDVDFFCTQAGWSLPTCGPLTTRAAPVAKLLPFREAPCRSAKSISIIARGKLGERKYSSNAGSRSALVLQGDYLLSCNGHTLYCRGAVSSGMASQGMQNSPESAFLWYRPKCCAAKVQEQMMKAVNPENPRQPEAGARIDQIDNHELSALCRSRTVVKRMGAW